MFTILILLVSIIPQGTVSMNRVQGSYIKPAQVHELRVVNSTAQSGLEVTPVQNPILKVQ